jgi:hypothetical protein
MTRGFDAVLPCRAALPSRTLTVIGWVIRRYRRQIGSAGRKLGPGRQVLVVLACLRRARTAAELAARSRSRAMRWQWPGAPGAPAW